MKKIKILSISLVIALITGLIGASSIFSASPPEKNRKIVVFQEGINEEAQKGLLKHFDAEDLEDLKLINGKSVILSAKAVKDLNQRKEVKRIDDDIIVSALVKPANPGKKPKEEKPQPEQAIPWGINRIDAELVWGANTGQGIKVGIIDSGIDKDHLDLKDNIKGGVNFVAKGRRIDPNKWDDDCGHGTHVAGTVAALDNEIGVVGVAPQANLYAIKVLNSNGAGYLSDVIKGLQWAIDNGMQVVNMSLGSAGDNQSYHDAIIAAYNAGITIVAAAGNDGQYGGKIYYPAKYPETIAVSASNINDELAYFSSYGEEIDLAAPGQEVNSTWNDGYYHIGNGTSMATPHVAGTAALILADPDLKCDLNNDLKCFPWEVLQKLEKTAEWLSGLTSDQQGAGLVDAEEAATGIETE